MFEAFPKMGRLYREIIITEKIDGTNAQILIRQISLENEEEDGRITAKLGEDGKLYAIFAGSRTRWLDTTSSGDNFGFAKWVSDNADELVKLGEGRHFGEWWGNGIQRGYGQDSKKFSLFNTSRWKTCCSDAPDRTALPAVGGLGVVPELFRGTFRENDIQFVLDRLRKEGSVAAPGFPYPEGIITYHTAARVGFKTTLEKDEQHKGQG